MHANAFSKGGAFFTKMNRIKKDFHDYPFILHNLNIHASLIGMPKHISIACLTIRLDFGIFSTAFGDRLMVGRLALNQLIGVQISVPEPSKKSRNATFLFFIRDW